MYLLRCLVFVEATHRCFIHPVYIDSKANHLADDLSCNNLSSFLSKVLNINPRLTPISRTRLDPDADWISLCWRNRFDSIFKTD